ncbi:MAG: hypothetical protein P8102_14105, partial [Gammaproteobacteria bacterium]
MPDSSAVSFDALALLTNGLVVAGTVAVFALLWRPAVRDSSTWSAIATPLASIIGSGFLVVAPLLGYTVGNWALFAMLGIVALAYAVGGAVRYNIRHLEKIAGDERTGKDSRTVFKWLERLAKLVLALAYVVAITFYLELLAAFVLRLFDLEGTAYQKVIATGLIIFIGAFGLLRGLKPLERLEEYSVDAKLAIIAGFLVGLAVVNIEHLVDGSWALNPLPVDWSLETLRKLLGAFLIVQGFETSRYMGNVYGADERIATMRYAQLLSAGIYLVFIALSSIYFDSFSSISETGIITLSERVAFIVPFMLVIGAVMAQFSAAVADTLASGGLVEAATYGKVQHRYVYAGVMVLALALLWSSHILAIIAYASRAFAGYYAIQCAMAAAHSAMFGRGPRRRLR